MSQFVRQTDAAQTPTHVIATSTQED